MDFRELARSLKICRPFHDRSVLAACHPKKNGDGKSVPGKSIARLSQLERVAERELHDARQCHRLCVLAERRPAGHTVVSDVLHAANVESRGIGRVEYFPTKADGLALRHIPYFREARVDAEVSGTTQIVALSGLSGIRVAEQRANLVRITFEDVGIPAGIPEHAGLGRGTNQNVRRSQLPVGGPEAKSGLNREGIAARPTINAGERPSAKDSLGDAVHSRSPILALAER